jgi:hypothetical protein
MLILTKYQFLCKDFINSALKNLDVESPHIRIK